MRRGLGIRSKLLLLLFVASLASSAAYTWFAYHREKAAIEAGLDARLLAGAEAAIMLTGSDYHDRIEGPQSIGEAEYAGLMRKLTDYARATGLEYVYTYVQSGERIVVTSSNATAEELRTGTYDRFFQHYETAAPSLYDAFRTRRRVFENLSDGYGSFRTVSIPAVTQGGRVFVAGADIRIDFVENQLASALRVSLLIGVAGFVLMFAAGHVLISRIVRPLAALTEYTGELVGADVNDEVTARIGAIAERRGDEVGSLAQALHVMIGQMAEHVRALEKSTAARERVEGELAAAREIQLGLLPRGDPPFPGQRAFDLHGLMEPAKAVGGDLYDFFMVDDRYLLFIIGDVSGKGVPAALFMAVAKALFKGNASALAGGRPDMARLLTLLNRQLCDENPQELFITIFAGALDIQTGEIEYCDAGHDPPVVIARDGMPARIVKQPGLAMGAIDDYQYRAGTLRLHPGETLLLYTDGITEAMNEADRPFSFEALIDGLGAVPQSTAPRQINEAVRSFVAAYAGGAEQSDDLTLLTIRFNGPAQVEIAA